ncbi:MAG TPA: sulfurtransferase [Burkholderiales bacterium]
MTNSELPLLIEPAELEPRLGDPGLRIVDLNGEHVHARVHVPGAVALDYAAIVAPRPPAAALLPDAEHLARVFSAIGLTPEHHVIAYDDEGNGRAARLLWTLHAVGHTRASLLNGGLKAWLAEGRPTESGPRTVAPTSYPVRIVGDVAVDRDYVLAHLGDRNVVLLDARTPEEYAGANKRAARAGHIPGAVNFNWLEAIDAARDLRLKDLDELRRVLASRGVTPDKEVITYCQTHHRSAHTYAVLKILGYPRVKAYPGSWSEWGNLPDTPIE